jgi:hypothetical protein
MLRREAILEFFGGLAPCVVAMEACGSAHHFGRQLVALGHEGETDPAGACETVPRRSLGTPRRYLGAAGSYVVARYNEPKLEFRLAVP